MANKVFINKENIVECQVVGDQDTESVRAMGKQIRTLLEELKAKHLPLLILDDVTKIGKVTSEGRQAVVALVKELEYSRLVMLGNNGLLRVGVNLISRAAGRNTKLLYFTDRRKAIDWLQSKS